MARDWKIQLAESGVTEEAIEYFGLRVVANGKRVEYPCQYPPRIDYSPDGMTDRIRHETRYRWRALPDTVKSARSKGHRVQRFGNPDVDDLPDGKMPVVYTPDFNRLRFAVQKAGGKLMLFEGDKDTWTAYLAGYENSAGLFAASSHIDDELVRVLKDLGVKVVYFYPDADFAGLSAAEKMMDEFATGGIELKIFGMRMYVDNVRTKDTSDIWLAVGQEPKRYQAMLSGLKEMKLASKRQRELALRSEFFIPTLYEEIETAYASRTKSGNIEYNSDGWAKEPIACLFHDHEHDDTSPAFYWHRKKKMAYCHKCATEYLAKDVADALGIRWRDYVNGSHEKSAPPSIETPDRQIEAEKDKELETTATMLNLGTSHMTDILTLVEKYEDLPDSAIFMPLDDALANYRLRYYGQLFPEYSPIEMPVKAFHKLGGFGRVLSRPIMVGLLGMSGGYKTTFLTGIVNAFAQQGINVIVWSPEWSPEKNADRIVQQFGGISMWQMGLLERHHWEQEMIKRGELEADDDSIFGEMPDMPDDAKTKYALNTIQKSFKGKVVYLKDFSPSVYHLGAQIITTKRRMTAAGHPPAVLIIDYAQMAAAPEHVRRYWSMEDTVTVIKKITLLEGFATFTSSQVRKADAELVMSRRGFLGSTSGLNFRDNQFNFFWTISPVPADQQGTVFLPNGELRHVLKVAVVKNSNGKTASNANDLFKFFVDPKRMLVTDEEHEDVSGVVMDIPANDPDMAGIDMFEPDDGTGLTYIDDQEAFDKEYPPSSKERGDISQMPF